MEQISWEMAASVVPERPKESNKGTFGRLLCVCGSTGMAGAAMLCAGAALRCGAGLVDAALPAGIYPIVAARLPEPVYTVYQEDFSPVLQALKKATACVFGCGFSTKHLEWVRQLLSQVQVPLVLDADALSCIAEDVSVLDTLSVPAVLTPHPGEMARLLDCTVQQVQADRAGTAARFAKQHGVVLVLKGAGTLVAAPDGSILQNPTGNPGMARGGSGDLLAGMLGAFLAQKADPFVAACAAVYLHGLAGDRCAARLSQQAMLPHDLLDELPEIFLEIERCR
ncbi:MULTISPECIES: NAD(P)H-hydrate dehydratase [Caproicibacterium]|uniref:ADP-dependent (S)-NAD(P)H-hydrate dehydratase n=1 Tax=Caproicibacterium argilliputei TaxID=3030016 RepID=A0AA97H2J9_9FIRM|nr:NAD(P)H-hydrate dehydratase [Caproicibacterium argilliputei]WOC31203.1 NAD(P)H-hydrate dehydratase [Caproicibacterium argilliputei]